MARGIPHVTDVWEDIDGFEIFEAFEAFSDEFKAFDDECTIAEYPSSDMTSDESDRETLAPMKHERKNTTLKFGKSKNTIHEFSPSRFMSLIPVIKPILIEEAVKSENRFEQEECAYTTPLNNELWDPEDDLSSFSDALQDLPPLHESSSEESFFSTDDGDESVTLSPRSPRKRCEHGEIIEDSTLRCSSCQLTEQKRIYRHGSIRRWKEKKKHRRRVAARVYRGRSAVASSRPRIGGRFIKHQNDFISVTEM